MIKDRRIGNFEISLDTINKRPGQVREIMCHVIVLRAEVQPHTNTIQYQAISHLFDKIDEATLIPEYLFELTAFPQWDGGQETRVTGAKQA